MIFQGVVSAKSRQEPLEPPGTARSRQEPPGAARSRQEPPRAASSREEPLPAAARSRHLLQIMLQVVDALCQRNVVLSLLCDPECHFVGVLVRGLWRSCCRPVTRSTKEV